MMSTMFCKKMLTANDVTMQRRWRLAAHRPERDQLGQVAREHRREHAEEHRHPPGCVEHRGREVDRVAGDHDVLAVREVDELEDAVHEHEAEREKRVEAPQAQRVDEEFADRSQRHLAAVGVFSAEVDRRDVDLALEFLGRAGELDRAVGEQVRTVDDLKRSLGVLLDEQDGRAALAQAA